VKEPIHSRPLQTMCQRLSVKLHDTTSDSPLRDSHALTGGMTSGQPVTNKHARTVTSAYHAVTSTDKSDMHASRHLVVARTCFCQSPYSNKVEPRPYFVVTSTAWFPAFPFSPATATVATERKNVNGTTARHIGTTERQNGNGMVETRHNT